MESLSDNNGSTLDGLILAGGQSRRMGQDKALLPVKGEPLLHHHINTMRPSVSKLYVAGNNVVTGLDVDISYINDSFSGSQGPLSGVLAALQQSDADLLWVMSCDNYNAPKDLASQLQTALQDSGADVACVKIAQRYQPLLSVMRTDLDVSLARYMADEQRAVFPWFNQLSVVAVELQTEDFWCNLNTQEDYQALLASVK